MFAGLISWEQPVSAWGDSEKILAALAPFSFDKPRDSWRSERQMLLQVDTSTGAESAAIYRHQESGVAVVFWGRLDNRLELIQQLEAVHNAFDDELIALAWLKWGEHCPQMLIGDFAFAVANPKAGVVFLARDVMGVKPLYYRADTNGIFFGNTVAAFKPLSLGSLTPSREWMAKFMLDLSFSHTETAYLEIKKLPGAHYLLIQANGHIKLHRYHEFIDDSRVEKKLNFHWLDDYKAVWQQAVSCRVPAGEKIGVENSGGIDSGSITAEIARQLGADIHRLYGMGFCFEPLEPQYIMDNAMKWGIRNNTLFSGGDSKIAETLYRRECLVSGYPNEHSNGSSHYQIYQHCQLNGIRVLNSGFGGDEVVTNQSGPVRAELFDQGDWRRLWRILPGTPLMKAGRFAKTVYHTYKPPAFNPRFLEAWRSRWQYHFIHNDVIEKYAMQDAYFATATYDEQFRTVNGFAMSRLAEPYVVTRLENCSLMASSFGIDYVWPLLDQRLVQQWLSSPSIWKMGVGGVGRYLHRKAISGVCVDSVTWKSNKDMGNAKPGETHEMASNRERFQKLLDLTEFPTDDVSAVFNIPKARAMAMTGIKEDWRGTELGVALFLYVSKLECMSIWLKEDFRT